MRIRRSLLLCLLLALVASGAAVAVARQRSPVPPPGPEPLGAAGQLCADALGRFANTLYRELADDASGGNLVVSPWSVWSSMASFATFCDGASRDEVVRALGFEGEGVTDETLRAGRAELLERMRRADRYVTLDASQAVWIERSLEIDSEAARSLRRESGVDLERVDFRNRGESASRDIAAWIRSAAGGGGPARARAFPPLTDLVLTDALSLRARWRDPFDARRTAPGEFQRLDGAAVPVPMMSHNLMHGVDGKENPRFAAVRLFEDDERAAATAVELPHRGERTSLILVLPDLADGLFDVESRLDVARLGAALDAAEPREIKVVVPRLSIRRSIDLQPALRAMGVESIFESVDLSRLFAGPASGRHVGSVSQGAALDVDEHGVRSWAFTEWHIFDAVPDVVTADHPFLVIVRERTSGAVLFVGRVLDPST
ncbi:MAG: serpin family protein [Planctomycetota bacterium]